MSDVELCLSDPEITQVSSLSSESFEERWKICVRVVSKSNKLRSDSGTEYFKVVLEDSSGQIDALAFGSQNVHKFFDKFEEDKVYFISDGNLVKVIKKNPTQLAIKDKEDVIDKVRNINGNNSSDSRIDTGIDLRVDKEEEKIQTGDEKGGKSVENEGKIQDEEEGKKEEVEQKVDENGEKIEEAEKTIYNENKDEKVESTSYEIEKEDRINLITMESDKSEKDDDVNADEDYFYEIHLESGTVVTRKDEDRKPRSPYTPITKLRHVNNTFVDVVGIVTGVWKLEMKYTQYRSINITDENGCDVNVALWGKLATDFNVKSISSVVSLKHVRVKKENGDAELQSTPNTELDYKPVDPEAVVLREILGLAEDLSGLENANNHCSRCQKRRGSYSSSESHSSKRRRYDSGNSSSRTKPKRNHAAKSATCKRRGNKQLLGHKGRKIYIRKRNSTRDYFKTDDSDSDLSDSSSEHFRETKGRRLPVRHCQSLYSEKMKKKRRVPTSSDDDTDDTDEDDDFTSDDSDASDNKKGKNNVKRGKIPNQNDKEKNKSSLDSTNKDGASSSKGPVGVISIETDDDSEVDGSNIKPVLVNKEEKKWKDSDSDATVSYLDGKSSSKKSGVVKKTNLEKRRKKQSSDEDFKASESESSSDDSSSDDSDDSNDDNKSDDESDGKEKKTASKKISKVHSSEKKSKKSDTDDDKTDDYDEETINDSSKVKPHTEEKRTRGRPPKKKNLDADNKADDKKNDANDNSDKPTIGMLSRPRRNICKKKNSISESDEEMVDDKVEKVNKKLNSTRKQPETAGSTCKQRKSVSGNKDVGKACSDGKGKSESTKELPRICLILRKTKKKVSYTEIDDKTDDTPEKTKASSQKKNVVSKTSQEENKDTASKKARPSARHSSSKKKRSASEEGDERESEIDAINSFQKDSNTRRSLRKKKSCDYDEAKEESDGDELTDSPVKVKTLRRSSNRKLNFTDDENDEKNESDHEKKRNVRSKSRRTPGKRKTNVSDEEKDEQSKHIVDENDLFNSSKTNLKTRALGQKRKDAISNIKAEDEDDLDDFDLIVETTSSAKKNVKTSDKKENVDTENAEIDTTNSVPTKSNNCLTDDENKSGNNDLSEQVPENRHSLRKRKNRQLNNGVDETVDSDFANTKDNSVSTRRRCNTRRSSSRQKIIVTDEDDDIQDEPGCVKKKSKPYGSTRKKKRYISDDENEDKSCKDKDGAAKSGVKKNMPKLSVVIDKLKNKDMVDYNSGSKNDSEVEESLDSHINDKQCNSEDGNNDKTNDINDDEVMNDEGMDSVLRQSAKKSSAVKRRQIGSDDEGDVNQDKDENEDDEVKSQSGKKKFKRIKTTVTSSQETSQSISPEDEFGFELDSGNESDTKNNSCEQVQDQVDTARLREIREDDDGTKCLLKHYILWFAMKAGEETLDEEDFQETIEAKNKLDARLEVVMNICQSQAWAADFRADIITYPKYIDSVKHSDLAGGDMRYLGNCQVCNRENHPWSVIVKLEGEPYDRESYQMKMKEEGHSSLDLPVPEYYMGCFCHPRTKLYHNLYHFGYNMFHKCKEKLEKYGDDQTRIDRVATDKSLFTEMLEKLNKYMKEAEEDYTEDGKRGNNKWTREYNW